MKVVNVRKSVKSQYNKPSIVYVWTEGETVFQNLAARKCRPYTTYKHLLNPLFAELGIPLDAKLAWNQKAGCSCPCSPGFNVKRRDIFGGTYNAPLFDEQGNQIDLHITISAD